MTDTRLRPRERLRLSERFDLIRRQGTWARGKWLSVGALPNASDQTRVGVRVQRGVRTSVARNRIKRVFRSAYRLNKASVRKGFDIIVVLYKESNCAEHVRDDFLGVCRRLRLLASS